MCILQTQLIYQRRRCGRDQIPHHRLIPEEIVLETGRQVETIIQRGEIRSPLVIDEVAHEQRLAIAQVVIELD